MDPTKRNIDLWILIIRIPIFLFFISIFTSIFSACSEDDMSTNTTSGNEILIKGMAFSPASKTITVGTTIKWTNQDAVTHTVTSGTPSLPSGLFDSGNLAQNGTFSYTFNQVGTISFYCKIHTTMTGTITVQAASTGGGGY